MARSGAPVKPRIAQAKAVKPIRTLKKLSRIAYVMSYAVFWLVFCRSRLCWARFRTYCLLRFKRGRMFPLSFHWYLGLRFLQ